MPTRKQRIKRVRGQIAATLKRLRRLRERLARLRRRRPHPAPAFLTMFDTVTPDVIPPRAEAVAGYVGGQWPTYKTIVAKFPGAKHLSIAVTSAESADCLDVEPGDATIQQAPGWLKSSRAKAANTLKPVLYTSLSQANALIAACHAAGIPRSSYLLWIAHWTKTPHLCGPECGLGFTGHADATQYDNRYDGKNLDVSLVKGHGFFRAHG